MQGPRLHPRRLGRRVRARRARWHPRAARSTAAAATGCATWGRTSCCAKTRGGKRDPFSREDFQLMKHAGRDVLLAHDPEKVDARARAPRRRRASARPTWWETPPAKTTSGTTKLNLSHVASCGSRRHNRTTHAAENPRLRRHRVPAQSRREPAFCLRLPDWRFSDTVLFCSRSAASSIA